MVATWKSWFQTCDGDFIFLNEMDSQTSDENDRDGFRDATSPRADTISRRKGTMTLDLICANGHEMVAAATE